MSVKNIITNYCRYNHWANKKTAEWLQSLDHDLLYKETASSYTSIDLTVQHMNRAQQYWIAVITEDNMDELDESIKYNDVEKTLLHLQAGSKRMLDIFGAYSEAELTQKLFTKDMVQQRYEFILHAVNHNTHHRGQLITMSRCLGVTGNIPSMDYEVFLWAEYS